MKSMDGVRVALRRVIRASGRSGFPVPPRCGCVRVMCGRTLALVHAVSQSVAPRIVLPCPPLPLLPLCMIAPRPPAPSSRDRASCKKCVFCSLFMPRRLPPPSPLVVVHVRAWKTREGVGAARAILCAFEATREWVGGRADRTDRTDSKSPTHTHTFLQAIYPKAHTFRFRHLTKKRLPDNTYIS